MRCEVNVYFSTELWITPLLIAVNLLQQEFADGLVEIRKRINGLENRTAVLESQQFSPTIKLSGEVIFSLGGVFRGDRALDSDRWRTINVDPAAGREGVKEAQYTQGDVNSKIILFLAIAFA